MSKKDSFLDFIIPPHPAFLEAKFFISSHDGSANFWAELDLNQRRHIANEFTVRPH